MANGYSRVWWQNYPVETTPLSADNLNRMDAGIAEVYDMLEDADFENIVQNLESIQANVSKLMSFRFITNGQGEVELKPVNQ